MDYSEAAEAKLETFTRLGYAELPICMAKTHLSFTSDPKIKACPVPPRGTATTAAALTTVKYPPASN